MTDKINTKDMVDVITVVLDHYELLDGMPESNTRFTPITILLETREDLLNLYHNNFDTELFDLLEETE